MISTWRAVQVGALAAAGALYLAVGYYAAITEHPPALALVVSLLPLLAMAIASSWPTRMRWPALALLLAAVLAVGLNLPTLQDHVSLVYFVQHAGAMGLLGVTFGSTLASGDDKALCSRMAAVAVRETLSADYLHYTWQVTLAWTLFFSISFALSIGLFFFGPLPWWSLFANVLTPILVGAMFAIEYAVRLHVLPDRQHLSIAQTIRAYQSYRRD